MRRKLARWSALLGVSICFCACIAQAQTVEEALERELAPSRLEADLALLEAADYTSLCLFDLTGIHQHPDRDAYVQLLRAYADRGWDIAIYAQEIDPATALELVDEIGAPTILVYEREVLQAFAGSDVTVWWWSGAAYPRNHPDRPAYKGWPDLRQEEVRADIAAWIVETVPSQVDGGLSLDYIRWNEVGAGREAEMVTDLVRRVRAQWDGPLSAAVYPYIGESPRHGGALSVGQRWDVWLEEDLVDFVYPMAYASEDLPSLIAVWASYEQDSIVPCLSAHDQH